MVKAIVNAISKGKVTKRPGNPDGDLFAPGFDKKIPLTIIELTPSMKKSVQEEGQSLFEILGIGTGAAIAAESISDSKGNNTISNLTQ